VRQDIELGQCQPHCAMDEQGEETNDGRIGDRAQLATPRAWHRHRPGQHSSNVTPTSSALVGARGAGPAPNARVPPRPARIPGQGARPDSGCRREASRSLARPPAPDSQQRLADWMDADPARKRRLVHGHGHGRARRPNVVGSKQMREWRLRANTAASGAVPRVLSCRVSSRPRSMPCWSVVTARQSAPGRGIFPAVEVGGSTGRKLRCLPGYSYSHAAAAC
jgi:hypothetical protein